MVLMMRSGLSMLSIQSNTPSPMWIIIGVSSFSLSARPLVFGEKGEIVITLMSSRSDASLTCDGQIDFELREGDVLILKIPEFRARLICSTQEKFFSALQSKLNWSGGPRA